jgi:hypothetical protein
MKCHIYDTKWSDEDLLIWQLHIVIKYRHIQEDILNYDDFNDEGNFFVTRLGHLLEKCHKQN